MGLCAAAIALALSGYGIAGGFSSSPRITGRTAAAAHPATSLSGPTGSAPPSASTTTSISPASSTTTPGSTTTTVPTTTSVPTTTTQASLATSAVLVEVLNGTGAPGLAGSVATALHVVGFSINGTGNASSFKYQTTIIAYRDGDSAGAQTLANHISGPTELVMNSSVPSDEVWLIVGSSFGSVIGSQ